MNKNRKKKHIEYNEITTLVKTLDKSANKIAEFFLVCEHLQKVLGEIVVETPEQTKYGIDHFIVLYSHYNLDLINLHSILNKIVDTKNERF